MITRRIQSLRNRLQSLSRKSADFWMQHGPDREYGGFHGTLDVDGSPVAPTDKGLIQQVRHLWSLSMWYAHKESTPEVRALADGAYSFVMKHFYDPASKEFAFKVNREGSILEPKKILYAQSFTIYALSEYARAFSSEEAKQTALELFLAIDARAHDDAHGGYDQRNDAYWMPGESEKETNTHIHLMEAFTTLYQVTKDERVRRRLEELAQLVTHAMYQPAGYAHKDFKLDWSLVGPPVVSYGHDIETWWLVVETAQALGRPSDPELLEPARTMGQNAVEWGYDPKLGGLFEEGPLSGTPDKTEKIWWVQAEAIAGLFKLYQRTGDEAALDHLEGTLDYVERYLLRPSGEWLWGVLPDGSVGPKGEQLGEEWKTSYHVLRALVYTESWMSDWLKQHDAI